MRKKAECISFIVNLSGVDKQRRKMFLNSQVCFSAYVSKGEAVGSLCLKKKKQTKTLALKSHRLAFRTWAKYSTSLCLRFLICEMGITCHEVVEKLKEIQ